MDLVRIFLDVNHNLNIAFHKGVAVVFALVILVLLIYAIKAKRLAIRKDVYIEEAELGIGNQKVKIKPNYQTIQVAYKLWVELNTRKLGLPIDEENDVILEIYDSWYEFFKVARELIKEIPAHKATNADTKKLILISTDILNKAVRPHLTQWQARYRGWHKRMTDNINNYDISPQELQKKFMCSDKEDCYATIVEGMKGVNNKLIYYKKSLEKIVFGKVLTLDEYEEPN